MLKLSTYNQARRVMKPAALVQNSLVMWYLNDSGFKFFMRKIYKYPLLFAGHRWVYQTLGSGNYSECRQPRVSIVMLDNSWI